MVSRVTAATSIKYAYIHGFASSSLSAKGVQLSQWFKNDFHVSLELPDLNIPNFRQQSVSRMVDHIEKKIIQSNSRWFLIGSSLGGLVSTIVAQRQPNLIESLLLLAPAFDPIQRWSSKINVEQWKIRGFINYFNPTTQCDEPVDYVFFKDFQNHPSYPSVTTCPITIIHGLHDEIVPIEASREYMQRIRSVNPYRTLMIEVDDDHNLRKEDTLDTIKKTILKYHNRMSH